MIVIINRNEQKIYQFSVYFTVFINLRIYKNIYRPMPAPFDYSAAENNKSIMRIVELVYI